MLQWNEEKTGRKKQENPTQTAEKLLQRETNKGDNESSADL